MPSNLNHLSLSCLWLLALRNTLFFCFQEKARKKTSPIGSLSQLVSPQRPAMLLVVQENQNPDGRYGFSCRYGEGSGLVVVEVDNSQLCVDDRWLKQKQKTYS